MRSSGIFLCVLTSAAALAVGGCAPKHAALLAPPARIDAFCGNKEPRLSALLSVMTSSSDKAAGGKPLTDAEVRALARRAGGVIGYWNEQPLSLPKTARALGESDEYARVRAAAVLTPAEGALSRPLYIKVRSRNADISSQESTRWITLEAFDVQNPCVEGHRSM